MFALLDRDTVHRPRVTSARVRTIAGRVLSRTARAVDDGALRLMQHLFMSGEAPMGEDMAPRMERWLDVYGVGPGNAVDTLAPVAMPLHDVSQQRARRRGGQRIRLRYRSDYHTLDPDIDDWYRSYDHNDRCDVAVWRHDDPSRPTVFCLHAWCMGNIWFGERVFAAAELYRRGFHVVLPTFPFHGTRTPSSASFGGQLYPSPRLDRTNEAMRQAVCELLGLREYLADHGHEGPFGLMGTSLGGYTSALLASLSDDWAFVIPVIAPVSFADIIWWHGEGNQNRMEAEAAGVDLDALREVWRMHTPLSYELAVDRDDVLVIAATGDAVVRPVHGDVLHQHWGEPQLRWVVGSHIAQTRWLSGHRVLRRGKLDFMAVALPFLERYL